MHVGRASDVRVINIPQISSVLSPVRGGVAYAVVENLRSETARTSARGGVALWKRVVWYVCVCVYLQACVHENTDVMTKSA